MVVVVVMAEGAALEESLGGLPRAAELAALVEALFVAAVAAAIAKFDPLETLSGAASRARLRVSQPKLLLSAQTWGSFKRLVLFL